MTRRHFVGSWLLAPHDWNTFQLQLFGSTASPGICCLRSIARFRHSCRPTRSSTKVSVSPCLTFSNCSTVHISNVRLLCTPDYLRYQETSFSFTGKGLTPCVGSIHHIALCQYVPATNERPGHLQLEVAAMINLRRYGTEVDTGPLVKLLGPAFHHDIRHDL